MSDNTALGDAPMTAVRFRTRPMLTPLEDRLAPATFLVDSPLDSGPGTLRQAVLDANALPGADSITFAIGTPGSPARIELLSPLPWLYDTLSILGRSQGGPGYSGAPLVELTADPYPSVIDSC